MRSSTEHTCAQCHTRFVLSGAQVFIPRPCPACGTVGRAREEIGGYRLHEVLRRSGLGVIFRAEDSAGGALAVKILQPALAGESTDADYFVSEVWAIARLNHPNCLRIFAAGVEHGSAWIAMEWLPHGSLADRLAARGRLREAEVLSIGVQAAAALGAAHAAGHSHRDLEPNNFVFADALTVKVTDFGQAALYQVAGDDLGTMWGRAWYVSPERLRNEPEEAHSDIYSLGATLFHALTGSPLHEAEPNGQTTLELLESGEVRVEDFVPALNERTVLVLNRMLAAEPAQRFQHWSEVASQLSQAGSLVARRDASAHARAAAPLPPAARPVGRQAAPRSKRPWVVATLLFFALAIVAGVVAWRHRVVAPVSRVVAVAPSPRVVPPTSAPPPTPAATPPPATPTGFDWRGWKTAVLQAPADREPLKAGATVVPPSGALRLLGSGRGLGAELEEGAFHFRTLEGNWTLTAHLVALDGMAGLSVREAAAHDRAGLSVWFTPERKAAAAVRKVNGAKLDLIPPVATTKASWLRLSRRGAVLTAEVSTNAKQWKAITRQEGVPVGLKPVVGFLVWSGSKARPATAVFDRVAVARVK